MNNIVVMGRICNDIEIKKTQSGKKFVSFSVADNYDKENTNFYSCSAFGNTAKFISEYFKKGSPILLTGTLKIIANKKDTKVYTNINLNVSNANFVLQNAKSEDTQNSDDITEDDLW